MAKAMSRISIISSSHQRMRKIPFAPFGYFGRCVKKRAWRCVRRIGAFIPQPEPSSITLKSRFRSLRKATIAIGSITSSKAPAMPITIASQEICARVFVMYAAAEPRAATAPRRRPPPAKPDACFAAGAEAAGCELTSLTAAEARASSYFSAAEVIDSIFPVSSLLSRRNGESSASLKLMGFSII